MKRFVVATGALFLTLFFSAPSSATDELGQMEEWELGDITVGGDIRVQGLATENVTDLKDDKYLPMDVDLDNAEFIRSRTRVWLDVDLWDNANAYVRLAAEPVWGKTEDPLDLGYHLIVIDNSYIQLSELFGAPISFRLGRQDLAYGEGFLVKEGTPADESRTFYFDAIRITINLGENNTADIFAAKINEYWRQDVLSGVSRDDEDLYGVYLTNRSLEDHHIELYGIHREHPAQNTTAIGTRLSGKLIESLSYGAEYTQQFGKYNERAGLSWIDPDADRDAWGWYVHTSYQPDLAWKPLIKLGCYMTSGDDKDTLGTYEQWDSLYSEWPKYSELYFYTNHDLFSYWEVDEEEGTWGNMLIIEGKVSVEPIEDLTITSRTCIFRANEENGLGDGKNRGINPQLLIKYKFTDNVSGHLLGEYFLPGDYYTEGADNAYLIRSQLYVRF